MLSSRASLETALIMWRLPVRKLKAFNLGLLALSGAALIALGVWIVTLDLNRHRDKIEGALGNALKREVKIGGDLRLSLRPLGVTLTGLVIADRWQGKHFVELQDVRLEFDLSRLVFEREWLIQSVHVRDGMLTVRRNALGEFNVSDFFGTPAARISLPVMIDGLRLERFTLVFENAAEAAPWTVTVRALTVGAVRMQEPIAVFAEGSLTGPWAPARGQWVLTGTLRLDADADQFEALATTLDWVPGSPPSPAISATVAKAVLQRHSRGASLQGVSVFMAPWRWPEAAITMTANAKVDSLQMKGGQVEVSGIDVAMQGTRSKEAMAQDPSVKDGPVREVVPVAARIQAARVRWQDHRATATVVADASMTGPEPASVLLRGDLTLMPDRRLVFDKLQGEARWQAMKAKFGVRFGSGEAQVQQGDIRWATPITVAFEGVGIGAHALEGEWSARYRASAITQEFRGQLDSAPLKARHGFQPGGLHQFAIDLSRVDIARWQSARSTAAPSGTEAWGERFQQAVHGIHAAVPTLRSLPLKGRVNVGQILDAGPPPVTLAEGVTLEFE